jgi:hypothetical protein
MTAEELFDGTIIWLGDDLICADNFPYFKEELLTILEALMPNSKNTEDIFPAIKQMEREMTLDQCLWYIHFSKRGKYGGRLHFSKRGKYGGVRIGFYSGDEFDLEDARQNYRDWVDTGFKPLKWSDLIGNTPIDTYDIFDKINESNEYSNVSSLINKKIWFDYPTEREDIEKVNQFLIDNGFRGLKSDNIDEFEDFIYNSDVAYFKLIQHTSPLHSVEEKRPYVDYVIYDSNPEWLKDDPGFIYYKDILNMADNISDIFSNLNESVEEPQPKVGDYLYCHKEVVMDDDGSKETTVGKFYQIKNVMRDRLEILNDHRGDHAFGTNPKTYWYYGIWFHLIPKEHKKDFDSFNPEDIFNQLD